jgi:stearoyl-CoA desaturase (Delta-9 desaturase)
LAGEASASQGSAFWWAREHRAHHRYTDTEFDPHSGTEGFLWTHFGWIILRTDTPKGATDTSDLRKNKLLMFQHRHYFKIFPWLAFVLPTVIPGYFWGDWAGGFYFATAFRLTIVHHVGLVLWLVSQVSQY